MTRRRNYLTGAATWGRVMLALIGAVLMLCFWFLVSFVKALLSIIYRAVTK